MGTIPDEMQPSADISEENRNDVRRHKVIRFTVD